jgi:tight adherence protein C
MTILPLFAGAIAMAAVAFVSLLSGQHRAIARRARRLATGGPGRAGAPSGCVGLRARAEVELAELFRSMGLETADTRRRISERLARAGLRRPSALLLFQAATIAAPVAGGLVAYALLPVFAPGLAAGTRLVGAAAGIAAGGGAPRLWLANRTTRRQTALGQQLTDALDLYVICVEAGLGLDAAMARVAREIAPAAPELADELELTAVELGFLPDRHEAFTNLLRRVPLPSFRGLVGIFQQTERYGTPLAEALRTLSAEYRTEALMAVEEKAARLPAVLTIPMIVFVLPPLFIVLLGPAILQLLALRQ